MGRERVYPVVAICGRNRLSAKCGVLFWFCRRASAALDVSVMLHVVNSAVHLRRSLSVLGEAAQLNLCRRGDVDL